MANDSDGTGTTTQQMQAAPHGAIFVWCNNDLSYPRHIARSIGRGDLCIVCAGEDWHRFLGYQLSGGVVIDHAARLDPIARDGWRVLDLSLRNR